MRLSLLACLVLSLSVTSCGSPDTPLLDAAARLDAGPEETDARSGDGGGALDAPTTTDAAALDDAGADDAGVLLDASGAPDAPTAATCPLAGSTTWVLRPGPTTSHSVSDLAFAPDRTLFATVFREGVFRAAPPCYDTWELVYALEAPWQRVVVSSTGIVVATTGIAVPTSTPPLPLAIVTSSNGGDTWTDILPVLQAGPFPDPVSFPSIAASPDSPWIYLGSGWRAGEAIFWRSSDGRDWTSATPTAARAARPRTVSVGIVAEPGGVVFMGTEGQGTWGSTDEGVTWPGSYREVGASLQGRELRRARCGAYVGSFDPGMGVTGGLYSSADGVAPFVELPTPPGIATPGPWSARVVGFDCTTTGQIVMIANQEVAGGARVVAIMDRIGGTWRDARDGVDATHLLQTLERSPDGYVFVAGTNGSVYRTRVPLD